MSPSQACASPPLEHGVGLLRRKAPRSPAAFPVDVLALRNGSSTNIPGRTTNISEGGLAAVLAGEFSSGDAVGVSFRLPAVARTLHAEAIIRHADGLCYGLEFLNASREQQEMIRFWSAASQNPVPGIAVKLPPESAGKLDRRLPWRARARQLKNTLTLALLLLASSGALAAWKWRREWRKLESRISLAASTATAPQVRIPEETMQKLLTYRVEPSLSGAEQKTAVHGSVTIDAVIGKDGGVRDLHSLSGPEPLAQAALDAVRGWRFEPYRIRGKPVDVETTLTVQFGPPS